MKLKTEKFVDSFEWDKLVAKTYQRPYCFQQQEGCRERGVVYLTVPDEAINEDDMLDSIPEIVNHVEKGVKFSSWLARDPKQPLSGEGEDSESDLALDLWWSRNFYPDLQTVANDLYHKRLLEAGEYGIVVDW